MASSIRVNYESRRATRIRRIAIAHGDAGVERTSEVARAWHALGFDELVVYADPYFMVPLGEEAPPNLVERIARDVLPDLRRELASGR